MAKIEITVIISLFLILLLCFPASAYDREAAVAYAAQWWNGNNPDYNYYGGNGGDCANFGSQSLIAGGVRFNPNDYAYQNYIHFDRQHNTVVNAQALRTGLINNGMADESIGNTPPQNLEKGDIIFLLREDGTAQHTLVVKDVTNNGVFYYSHSSDPYPNDGNLNVFDESYPNRAYLHIRDSPIVKQVILMQNYKVIYHAYHSYTTNSLEVPTSETAKPGKINFKIIFDTKMDQNNLPIIGVGPPFGKYTVSVARWSKTFYDSDTLEGYFDIPDEGLYNMSIFARGSDGSPIDPDEDLTYYDKNNQIPDILHQFKIGPPCKIKIDTPIFTIPNGQTKTHNIKVKNNWIPENKPIILSTIINSQIGWSVIDGVNGKSIIINPGGPGQESGAYPITVTNNGALQDLDITIKGDANGLSCTYELYDGTPADEHLSDHPDDSFIISSPRYPTPWLVDTESDTGILMSGWGEAVGHVLSRYNVSTAIVKKDLTILDEPYRELNDLKVLIIGSAGLTGLDNSPTFRHELAGFVDNGGTLVVLTSQHGYEFNALPGGEVSGYGWNEDQSCQYQSVGFGIYHPILSGQGSITPSINADGYFTKWPKDAKILLSRTKNGMPAMIMYKYGNGWVIATTMYDDWAYSSSSATSDGLNLIRDIVAWAKNPKNITTYAPGDTLNMSIIVTNSGISAAEKISFRVFDPNKKVVGYSNASVTISSGETKEIYFNYTAPSALGIWLVDYSLLDSNDTEIQDVYEAERFAISRFKENPDGFVYQGSTLSFAVTSPDERVAYGTDIPFTVHIWNNGDTERTIKSMVSFIGSTQIEERTISVPAKSESTFTFIHTPKGRGRVDLFADFYDGSNHLGQANKVVFLFTPSLDIKINTDQQKYDLGENVSVSLNISNRQSVAFNSTVTVRIVDPENTRLFEESFDANVSAHASENKILDFMLPFSSKIGTYIVSAEVFNKDSKIGYGSNYFEVAKDYTIRLDFDNLNKTYRIRQNISMDVGLVNAGASIISTPINVSIPDVGFNDSNYIIVNPNQTEIVHYDVSLPENLIAGKHNVIVTIGIDNSTSLFNFIIPQSHLFLNIENTNYTAGKNITLNVENTGGVDIDFGFDISLYDIKANHLMNDMISDSILAGASKNYSFLIPGQAVKGYHHLFIWGKDISTNTEFSIVKELWIEGVKAELTAQTEKEIYLNTENIKVLSQIINNEKEIDTAKLHLEILSKANAYTSTSASTSDFYSVNLDEAKRENIHENSERYAKSTDYELLNDIPHISDHASLTSEVKTSTTLNSLVYNPDRSLMSSTTQVTNDVSMCTVISSPGYYVLKNNIINSSTSNCINIISSDVIFDGDGYIIDGVDGLGTIGLNVYYSSYPSDLTNITIKNLKVTDWGYGIYYYNSLYGNIDNITANSNSYGFIIYSSIMNITNNTASMNDESGIMLSGSGNILTNNSMTDNRFNFYLNGFWEYYYFDNSIDTSNTVDGKSIYYIKNGKDTIYESLNAGAFYCFGCNNVTIKNLTLTKNSNGVLLLRTNNSRVENVNASLNTVGLGLYYSDNNTLNNNTANANDAAIIIEDSNNITLTNNSASLNNFYGISLYYSNNNTLKDNTASLNNEEGITLICSSNNILTNNSMTGSMYNFYFIPCKDSDLDNNIDTGNTVDGRSIYYIKNGKDTIYESLNAGAFYCILCNNVTIKNLTLTKNFDGVFFWRTNNSMVENVNASLNILGIVLYYSDNNTLNNNTANSNEYGIMLDYSNINNTLVNNTANSNINNGIRLFSYSDGNVLINNTANSNKEGGISLDDSNNNTLTSNVVNSNWIGIRISSSKGSTLASNNVSSNMFGITLYSSGRNSLTYNLIKSNINAGIHLTYSSDNTIYNNYFSNINNADDNGNNYWNTTKVPEKNIIGGYFMGGNYWSDYTGIDLDGDGVGDNFLPYNSSARIRNGGDYLPLVMFEAPPPKGDVLWSTEEIVSIPEMQIMDFSHDAGKLNVTGKLYLKAELISSTNQTIAMLEYPLYIVKGGTAVIFNSDKKYYKPGEIINISGKVINLAEIAQNLTLVMSNQTSAFYSETIELPAGTTHNFSASTSTMAEGKVTLNGKAGDTEVEDYVWVEKPGINVSIVAPDVVGRELFDVNIDIKNTGNVSADLHVVLDGNSWNITLPGGESGLLSALMSIRENTTLNVNISGDVNQDIEKNITFGENVRVNITPQNFYREGEVEIQYRIENHGIMDSMVNITFNVSDQSVLKTFYIPEGQSVDDSLSFNLTKGEHLLEYTSPFERGNVTINVATGAEFVITRAPSDMVFTLGQDAVIQFRVKNIGGAEGKADLHLTIPGIYEDINGTWILPNAEDNVAFNFAIPDDLEEKTYKVFYELGGKSEETSLFVQGAKIEVNASLDKDLYLENDTAVLTIEVNNMRDFDLEIFSRVKFNEYDSVQYFNLSSLGEKTLSFEVPVHFTGDKIFYSVYMASGRSLYINSMYIHEMPKGESGITLYTDKQVYNTGETVNTFVNVSKDGTLNLTAPKFTTGRELKAGDSTLISFTVPELKSGTYYIDYTFDNFSSSYPFDVNGYSAKILEFTMDNEIYDIGDRMKMNMLIEASRNFSGAVKIWIYGQSAGDSFEFTRDFVKGDNRIELNRTLITEWSGIHSTVYGVYAEIPGNSLVLLASGAEYFDVVDHVPPLITITSPQDIEYTTNSVVLSFTIEDTSDIEWTGYSLDGAENVTISGSTLLTDLLTGSHTIAVYARDSAGNTGSASVAFTVNITQEDVTPPIITIVAPEARNYLHSENITLNFTAIDMLSGIASIEASLDGISVTDGQMIELRTLTLGMHIFEIRATDRAGNNASKSVEFKIDPVPATVDVKPDTLNKDSQSDKNAITAYIEIPGYDINMTNISTVVLNTSKGNVPAQPQPSQIGDYDSDNIPDIMVKFDRKAVIAIVEIGDNVRINISGSVAGILFEGSDIIRVIKEPGTKSSGDHGSSGGGSGVITSEPFENIANAHTIENDLLAGQSKTYNFSSIQCSYEIAVTGSVNENDVTIRVEELKGMSKLVNKSPQGKIYTNFNVWTNSKNIREAFLKCRVENRWMISNGFKNGDIKFNRWNKTSWQQLETTEFGTHQNYTYFEVKTNGFSHFAVTGLKHEAALQEIPASTVAQTPEIKQSEPQISQSSNLILILYILIPVLIISGIYYYYRRKI